MEPIELSFDNEFLECICIENPKGVNVILNNSVNCKKEYCRFNLMNTGDWFTLQFVSLQKLSTPIVNSRIAGLPKGNIMSSSSLGKILSSARGRSLSSGGSRTFPKVSTNKQMIKRIVILITVVVALVYFYQL